jgi:hypothetical protein
LENVNANNSTNRTFTITLIINSSSNKVYANVLTVNGTNRTLFYNSGSSNIPSLTSAQYILQTISIIYGSIVLTDVYCFTTIIPYF